MKRAKYFTFTGVIFYYTYRTLLKYLICVLCPPLPPSMREHRTRRGMILITPAVAPEQSTSHNQPEPASARPRDALLMYCDSLKSRHAGTILKVQVLALFFFQCNGDRKPAFMVHAVTYGIGFIYIIKKKYIQYIYYLPFF